MPGDFDLFGNAADDYYGNAQTAPEPVPEFAAAWQVNLLRKALDSRGLTDMAERQRAIENVVGRSVESLRMLTQVEALEVLDRFADTASKDRRGSAWDERDEETWIDRL